MGRWDRPLVGTSCHHLPVSNYGSGSAHRRHSCPHGTRHYSCSIMLPGEKLIGARAYRVVFALVSLPLAIVALVYFINHRYDGERKYSDLCC